MRELGMIRDRKRAPFWVHENMKTRKNIKKPENVDTEGGSVSKWVVVCDSIGRVETDRQTGRQTDRTAKKAKVETDKSYRSRQELYVGQTGASRSVGPQSHLGQTGCNDQNYFFIFHAIHF